MTLRARARPSAALKQLPNLSHSRALWGHVRGHRSLLGNFGIQGWIGVYRNKHSFLYPPKRKSAESRDVLVKSRGLEGKISSDPYFSFRVENPFCFPFFFQDYADLRRHPEIQKAKGGLLGHRRGKHPSPRAHPEPQDSLAPRRTRGRGRQKPISNERKELELPQDLRESAGGGGAGRPARPNSKDIF